MRTQIGEQARDALRMVESDPRRAVVFAEQAYRSAVANKETEAASLAKRAWGYGAFHLEDTEVAVRHLRHAIRLGVAAGSPQLAAEARMALAAVLNWRGRQASALREIEAALAGLDGVEHARALVQQGAILQLLGRADEALPSYRSAMPVLRRAGDVVWVQRVLLNRGVLHGQRREFTAALDDLHAAERLCAEQGLDLALGFAHQNLGFVHGRRGDVPTAIAYLDRAEARFRGLRSQLWSVLSDRAELLLSVRLVTEAEAAAEEAVAECKREGRRLVLPEARLLLARAALLNGDLPTADRQARLAQREFATHRKADWAALARFTVLRCQLDAMATAGDGRRGPGARLFERTADLLTTSWPDAALDARLAAATIAIQRGRRADALRLLTTAGQHRRHGVAICRARGWYAEALLQSTRNNPTKALRAIRAGLRVLDEHVAGLGATDLRAHAAGHRTELAELGLRIVIRERPAHHVFEWAELGKASHLAHRPVRPPEDPEFAASLAQLRAIAAEINEQRSDARRNAQLTHRQAALERQVRDHYRRQTGTTEGLGRPPSVAAVSRALGHAALLEFIQHDTTLLLLTVIDGRARLRTVGAVPRVGASIDALFFALRRLTRVTPDRRSHDAGRQLLGHSANQLDSMLLGEIAAEIGDRSLVIVPTGPLQSLPWSVLPSCHGRPVTVAPSARLWLRANDQPSDDSVGRVVVVAGPDLPGAAAEAEAVAAIHGTTPLSGADATVDAVTKALDGAALAHLATHGRIRADNPLFSALRFADGPLMAYDIEALAHTPDTVILAACDTGRPVTHVGDELMGLGATLLANGTRRLVAPVLDVLDVETAPLMTAVHRLLAAGHPVANALAEAQSSIGFAPFVCLGACL